MQSGEKPTLLNFKPCLTRLYQAYEWELTSQGAKWVPADNWRLALVTIRTADSPS
jgi:hypothetical protein